MLAPFCPILSSEPLSADYLTFLNLCVLIHKVVLKRKKKKHFSFSDCWEIK